MAQVPVGLDLEPADRYGSSVMRTVADEAEFSRVAAAGVPGAFAPTVLWTLKEAALKGAGVGLTLHPRRVVIAERRRDDWIVHVPKACDGRTKWAVTSVIRDGWAMAIARPLTHDAQPRPSA